MPAAVSELIRLLEGLSGKLQSGAESAVSRMDGAKSGGAQRRAAIKGNASETESFRRLRLECNVREHVASVVGCPLGELGEIEGELFGSDAALRRILARPPNPLILAAAAARPADSQ